MTFTTENTQGFTTAEIATLNEALAQLRREQPDVDEKNHSDAINNAWHSGMTAGDLVAAARRAA